MALNRPTVRAGRSTHTAAAWLIEVAAGRDRLPRSVMIWYATPASRCKMKSYLELVNYLLQKGFEKAVE
jgi:hypothetical protein